MRLAIFYFSIHSIFSKGIETAVDDAVTVRANAKECDAKPRGEEGGRKRVRVRTIEWSKKKKKKK